jgi:hypothetical protein
LAIAGALYVAVSIYYYFRIVRTMFAGEPGQVPPVVPGWGARVGCYVVNEPDRMQQLAAAGLWGFVTDVPDVARAALGPRHAAGAE